MQVQLHINEQLSCHWLDSTLVPEIITPSSNYTIKIEYI